MTDLILTGVKLVAGLAIVIALIYLTGFALRAVQRGRIAAHGRPTMEIRESLGLGPGKALHLVRVADRFIVVGATSGNVTALAEVKAESLEGPGRSQSGRGGSRGFRDILEAYTRRLPDEAPVEGERDGGDKA